MVLALYCYCGDNVKYGFLSEHLFQRKQQYGAWKNLILTSFKKKLRLPLITWDKKHLSKQVTSITYTLEKKVFQLLLWRFVSRFDSGKVKKTWSVLWSVRVFFAFTEKRRPNNYYLWKVNLISHMDVFNLMG